MSGKKLVIVESPTKARTIGRMLGSDYQIMASMGHVRDLPEHSFGVDTKNNFAPVYQESKRGAKTIKELKKAAKTADSIYLAPDPDREGEAIAWHLEEILKTCSKGDFYRVTFHEITKNAINRAFQSTGQVNMSLVNAQQARRVLDRLVGYQVSPLLWSQIQKGISAGRVQSVALRLICEREREILAFVPEEYWNFAVKFEADYQGSGLIYDGRLALINGEKFKIDNESEANTALEAIKGGSASRVTEIRQSPKRRNAPPPFITSTLQQAANNLLHFSASHTMRIAQQLYEGMDIGTGGPVGLITYMRTDSVNIAREAQDTCRAFIANNYGNEYVPAKPNFYKSKSSAQEAHEAIRPTDVTFTPEMAAKYLDEQQLKLYTLIWKRFVASQMSQCLQSQTSVDTTVSGSDQRDYIFRSTALVTTFPGFMKLYGQTRQDDVGQAAVETLGKLKEGMFCGILESGNEQKFTEPPPRFSEATLIKELETNGIGRPSTYATILRTIQARNYVQREKGRLFPSELGFNVNDFLVAHLPHLFEVDFTSKMETRLDEIEEGSLEWTEMLQDFYDRFVLWVDEAKTHDAPTGAKVGNLLVQLSNIEQWAPPEKNGRRIYDDHKFFNSVKDKFKDDGKITARQWQALLKMTVKYADQLPNVKKIAQETGFDEELKEAARKQQEMEAKRIQSAASAEDMNKYDKIFECFSSVEWEAAKTVRGRTYDDKKFFDSLKQQAESGKVLSEKQLGVIQRFAEKYKESITEFDKLCEMLNISPDEAAEPEKNEEVEDALAILARVKTWDEPVKKGRRTYDDKEFFESITNQYKSGKRLSPKQIFALKKLSGKYASKI